MVWRRVLRRLLDRRSSQIGWRAAPAWQVRWLRAADTLQVADRLRDLDVPRG